VVRGCRGCGRLVFFGLVESEEEGFEVPEGKPGYGDGEADAEDDIDKDLRQAGVHPMADDDKGDAETEHVVHINTVRDLAKEIQHGILESEDRAGIQGGVKDEDAEEKGIKAKIEIFLLSLDKTDGAKRGQGEEDAELDPTVEEISLTEVRS